MIMKKTLLLSILVLLGMSQAAAQSDDYLPIVREGVKWVNEKVIINHGDTTRYYYCYEFCGIDSLYHNMLPEYFHACYYYEGDHLNVETDSLIANMSGGSCFRNAAQYKIMREGRNLCSFLMYTDGGTRILYSFGLPGENTTIDYYLACQIYTETEPVLSTENFTEVEPIEIEGISCRRYAYVKENGDTMCYVVEGIGFDSRNMGDLLTPFTREPDPDADYQEYCGLCHVVKDGQIIYKGMRYTPDNMTGIDEVVAEKPQPRQVDDNYYNLMGQPVGKDIPTTPGIYIHHGKKIVVR